MTKQTISHVLFQREEHLSQTVLVIAPIVCDWQNRATHPLLKLSRVWPIVRNGWAVGFDKVTVAYANGGTLETVGHVDQGTDYS